MSVDLGAIPETAPSPQIEVGGSLAQVWRNIFPWSDLNAKLPPERYLSLGQEILPSLAVLAAQGPDQPRLLQTDLLARLVTVGSLNAVDKATAQKIIGSAVIQVNNPNLFAPGSFIAVQPAAGGATLANSQFYQVLGPTANPGELSIAPALTAQVNAGDFIVSVPAVWIAGQSLNVQVGNSIAVSSLPAITIAAAQQVNIGNTVTVAGTINIGNTPSVTIASGTVNIGNTPSINIAAQSVRVNVGQGQVDMGGTINGTVTFAIDAGWHSIGVLVTVNVNPITLSIKGHTSGTQYLPTEWQSFNGIAGTRFVVPLTPLSSLDSQIDVVCNVSGVHLVGILDAAAAGEVFTKSNQILNAAPPGYDVDGTSAPAAGSQASVVFAATPGKAYTAAALVASLTQNTGAGSAFTLQLLDGVAVRINQTIGVTATIGDGRTVPLPEVAVKGAVGNSMTWQFAGVVAGVFESVFMGAYLR